MGIIDKSHAYLLIKSLAKMFSKSIQLTSTIIFELIIVPSLEKISFRA